MRRSKESDAKCPFCGSLNLSPAFSKQYFNIYCGGCEAVGPPALTEAEAWEKWNERWNCSKPVEKRVNTDELCRGWTKDELIRWCKRLGIRFKDCKNGHYQLIGRHLINFYPSTNKTYKPGDKSGVTHHKGISLVFLLAQSTGRSQEYIFNLVNSKSGRDKTPSGNMPGAVIMVDTAAQSREDFPF